MYLTFNMKRTIQHYLRGGLFFLVLVLMLYAPGIAGARQLLQISGQIVDEESGEGIAYASLGVAGLQSGTSAQADGTFTLRLQGMKPNDSLQVSCLGYEVRKISLYSLSLEEPNVITLKPVSTMLEELVISDVPLTAEELVRSAIKAQRKVYNRHPYLMEARYAEVLETEAAIAGYTEAWGYLYMGTYGLEPGGPDIGQTADLAQWKQIRRSGYPLEKKGADDFRYLRANRLLQIKDFLTAEGPLSRKGMKRYQYELLGQDAYDGRTAWWIGFVEENGEAEGEFHIMEDDFAVVSLHYGGRSGPARHGAATEAWMKSLEAFDFRLRYAELSGTYYLNVMSLNYFFRDGEEQVHVGAQLAGSHYTTAQVPELNNDQRLILYSEMINPLVLYDPEFWEAAGPFTMPTSRHPPVDPHRYEEEYRDWDRKRLVPLPEGYSSYEEMYQDRVLMDQLLRGGF